MKIMLKDSRRVASALSDENGDHNSNDDDDDKAFIQQEKWQFSRGENVCSGEHSKCLHVHT